MNYRPNPKEWVLRNTWMFPDPDGRRMHLFYLANRPGDHWEWVGHVVSEDLVHWQEQPAIQVRCPADSHDVGIIGTGMVFQGPDGEFLMSYTANFGTKRARIAFLHSRDLLAWEKRWPEPLLEAQPPHYNTAPEFAPNGQPAFRDAFVHRVTDGYEALICAESVTGQPAARGCVARYRNPDRCLQKWEPWPPLLGPGLAVMMEAPGYFEENGRHYVLWSNLSEMGPPRETATRRRVSGTFYAMSEAYEGPYLIPKDNLLIGAGDSASIQSYAGRTIRWRGERLLYHHLGAPSSSFAFPKRIMHEVDGTLYLGYWLGIEQIHSRQLSLPLDCIRTVARNIGAGTWSLTGEKSLHGTNRSGGSLVQLKTTVPADLHLRCRVTTDRAARVGVTLRDSSEERARHRGVAVQADLAHGEWQFGAPVHRWFSRIDPLETVRETPRAGQTWQLDLLVRDIYFEAYINGRWRFTRVIPDHAREGTIGFFVETGTARFEDIAAWELTPMDHRFSR
jgi:hypothetical protein